MHEGGLLHLTAPGASLVLDVTGPGLPEVLHWGAALGDLDVETLSRLRHAITPRTAGSGLDMRVPLTLPPQAGAGYVGTPGLRGHRDGKDSAVVFSDTEVDQPRPGRLVVHSVAPTHGLALTTDLELSPTGMLRVRHAVTNDGPGSYVVDGLDTGLPLPPVATEIIDFTGHHCRERHPQRHPVNVGTWTRSTRRGRPGFNSTIGLLVGSAGFGFRHGEVWALHVGWSGNHQVQVDRVPEGSTVLGGGELLEPGEIVLEPGTTYETPWLFAAYSDRGIDGISAVFHGWLRARPRHPGPDRPRKLLLNTWEAVFFDQDLQRLSGLVEQAADLGVELFVLDDGWFRHRRDDTAGLGDWSVDEAEWPDGLHPLVERVQAHGMAFGLWVEPEMVNPDSDLYRAHPDWVLAPLDGPLLTARHQVVLDLANPDAYAYLLERLDALLTEYPVAFLKWDHNRDLNAGDLHDGGPAAHGQTIALYRLLDELRARHPGTEIESCASGGGRVDLGILYRTDRVWASDSNDALERQSIQRWTGVFLPPELLGAHVGAPRAKTTGRTHDLSFRAATALFGHPGLEWDISEADGEDRAALASWIAFYKEHRALLHGGDVVRADHPDPAVWVHGVVGRDRSQALFCVVQLATSVAAVPDRVRLPGLDPDRRYRVRAVHPAGPPRTHPKSRPPWYVDGDVVVTGRILEMVGLQPPELLPEQALLLLLEGVDGS
jgi:alpha-galactosidase